MSNRKGFAAVAACAALCCAGLVRADDSASFQDDNLTLSPSVISADAAAPRRPLMYALDKMGLAKTMDNWNLSVYGHAEGSYTYSFSNPPGNVIAGRVFDIDNQDITLNQLDLTIQKAVDASKGKWDVGFLWETMYGGDARFIHSNGMDFYGPGSFEPNPDEQFDITQAYLDIAIPVGSGLEVKAGKFVTLLGNEVINPEGNALYSHSFLFGYAIPFTQTGVIGTYKINDKVTVTGGITRGWNQSLKDNNGAIDGIGEVIYTPTDKTTITFNASVGPEAADNNNWWWVGEGIVSQKIGDQLTLSADTIYGLFIHGDPTGNGKPAMWYGAVAYASYTLTDMFTLNGRAEWYDDQDGFTLTGVPNTVYEVTFGVAIKPMPNNDIGKNLVIRPEIRYDYSDKAFWDAGTEHYQWTAALDVYFTF